MAFRVVDQDSRIPLPGVMVQWHTSHIRYYGYSTTESQLFPRPTDDNGCLQLRGITSSYNSLWFTFTRDGYFDAEALFLPTAPTVEIISWRDGSAPVTNAFKMSAEFPVTMKAKVR